MSRAVRRLRQVLAFTLLAGAVLAPTAAARAQEEPQVRLTLVEQSTFSTPKNRLRVTVVAENRGTDPLENLGMTLWVYNPARSRTEYRQALEEEPPLAPVLVSPFPVRGTLAPGQHRVLTLQHRLPELTARGENAIHPIKVQLESDGFAVGLVRSALVFVGERPVVPLSVSVTFVLDEGIAMRPNGEFVDDRLARAVAPGGRVDVIVTAIERAPISSTLVISPLLLDQLDRMSRGYRVASPSGPVERPADGEEARAAAATLDRLRAIAGNPTVEVIALPLASPSMPWLVAAGLRRDLESQIVRGHDLVAGLLGAQPVEGIIRPPGSELSPAALRALATRGVHTVVVDEDTFPPPAGLTLTPPGTALIPVRGGRTITAVTPDPQIADLLRKSIGDPALQSQWLLGDLSSVYFEQPSAPRGIALVIGAEGTPPDSALLSRTLARLRRASPGVSPRTGWLEPVKVSRLIEIPPQAGLERRSLQRTPIARPSARFLLELRRARDAIEQLESVTEEQAPLVEALKNLLLTSESATLLARENEAIAFLTAVRARIREEFEKVETPSGTRVTLTSRQGVIPITVGSSTGYPMRVRVRLVSPRLRFEDPGIIVLDRAKQRLTFEVTAQTTGRFPVRVVVETPAGSRIAESRIIVRSTAYNRRALLVVAAAALFLIVLWVRRVVPRATS